MPKFCPKCGKPVEVVRHVAANIHELLCEACKYSCVLLADDMIDIEMAAS